MDSLDAVNGPGTASAEQARVAKCVAALLAAGIGMLALSVVSLMTEFSAGLAETLKIHKGIGPYSGKMLVSVIFWLLSWAVLSPLFSKRVVEIKTVLYIFIAIMALATLLLYPPFIHILHP